MVGSCWFGFGKDGVMCKLSTDFVQDCLGKLKADLFRRPPSGGFLVIFCGWSILCSDGNLLVFVLGLGRRISIFCLPAKEVLGKFILIEDWF